MIEQELKDITNAIMKRAEMGQATQREIAEVLEAWAKLDDLYTDIQDRCMLDGMLKDGKFDETGNTVLTEADLKVFNEKYPVPGDALKGDEAVGRVLNVQR